MPRLSAPDTALRRAGTKMEQRSTPAASRGQRKRRRKILLCVTGGRPQSITQAVYALATQAAPWLPDEIVVVTTERGRAAIVERLLDGGVFAALCRDIGAHGIRFGPGSIHLIVRSKLSDKPLYDIVTPAHERAAGDFILDVVARITDDPSCELRVALAGERYLVSFFAGHALSLLGRRQDRLMHVHVDEARHDDDEFFYPRDAVDSVAITDVPFMRVDRLVSMRLLARHVDYATMCTAFEDRAHLRVHNAFRGIVFTFSRAFDIPCDSSHHVQRPRFEPRAAALYAYYALRARNRMPFVSDAELIANPGPLLELYDACLLGGSCKSLDPKWRSQLSRDALISARSRIARTLKALIYDGAKYQAYRVQTCRDDRSYGLGLDAGQISFSQWGFADGDGRRGDDSLLAMRGRP